jgi:hypothetical protein
MANRSHSEIENSGNGRYLSVDSVQELINKFKQYSDNLNEDDIVKVSLDTTAYTIFNTFFKWFPYVITDDHRVKNPTISISVDNDYIVIDKQDTYSNTIPCTFDTSSNQLDYKPLIDQFLNKSNYANVDCQSYDSYTDKLSGILVMRESHLHQMQYFKDCLITANNCDIDTIRALEQTNTISLPVHSQDNNLNLDSIKNHCEQSSEFIAGIIIPEDVTVTKEIVDLLHGINAYVYKQCAYKEMIDSNKLSAIGVDIIGFGPIAVSDELSPFLPASSETGTSISYGSIYNKPAHERSVAILQTITTSE